jgi:hypothetical protein
MNSVVDALYVIIGMMNWQWGGGGGLPSVHIFSMTMENFGVQISKISYTKITLIYNVFGKRLAKENPNFKSSSYCDLPS